MTEAADKSADQADSTQHSGDADSESDDEVVRPADRALNLAEDLVYILAGLLLLGGAVTVLVAVGYHLAQEIGDGVEDAITSALDGLLLVFILLELLAAVRATMTERKLVAEPFLVAGIIASIKEIIVVTLGAKESMGKESRRLRRRHDAAGGAGRDRPAAGGRQLAGAAQGAGAGGGEGRVRLNRRTFDRPSMGT